MEEALPAWDPNNMVPVYDWIYRHPIPVHGPYGSHTNRDPWFMGFLKEHLPPGSRVLDASCGRGHLARACREAGWEVEATEVSQWLIDNELTDLKVHRLTYAELDQLPAASFDAVLSNDVLEHLPTAGAVFAAMKALRRLTRKYLLFSVGTKHRAWKYPLALGYGKQDLHLFCPGQRWWAVKAKTLMTAQQEWASRGTYFIAGKVT